LSFGGEYLMIFVKRACAREAVPFDNDTFNELVS
jgi:hypothetical protein